MKIVNLATIMRLLKELTLVQIFGDDHEF